jgi:hypothetical protein
MDYSLDDGRRPPHIRLSAVSDRQWSGVTKKPTALAGLTVEVSSDTMNADSRTHRDATRSMCTLFLHTSAQFAMQHFNLSTLLVLFLLLNVL